MKSTKFRTILAGGVLLSTVVIVTPQTLAATQNGVTESSKGIQPWVERLGGNPKGVAHYLANDTNQGTTVNSTAFAQLVTQSSGEFGAGTWTPTGQMYYDPSTKQSYPIYKKTYKIYESKQPKALGTSVPDNSTSVMESSRPQVLNLSIGQKGVVTQGQPLKIIAKVNVPLWSGLANFHYDAVKVTNNASGQVQWVVSGNGDYTINGINMKPVAGGHGMFTDQLKQDTGFSTSSLRPGTYTATIWVADGVQRMDKPVTTIFHVE